MSIYKAPLAKLFLPIVLFGLIICKPGYAESAEAIPALKAIPAGLSGAVREKLTKRKIELEKKLKDFLTDADLFNATSAENQKDDDFATLAMRRARYIADTKAFNRQVNTAHEAVNKTLPATLFKTDIVKAQGDFCFELADGRKMPGPISGVVPINAGTRITTGANGKLIILLPDQTVFHIGPNSDLIIDAFVYDPEITPQKIFVSLSKGLFRWVTGKVGRMNPANMKVTVPCLYTGIRGTEFEMEVAPDGSGQLKLFSGELVVTPLKHGSKFILKAKQIISFSSDGIISKPVSLNDLVSRIENIVE
jgi:hypothetical protein